MNIGERCWLLTDSIADLGELALRIHRKRV